MSEYYILPNGDFFSAEDTTIEDLILLGYSDDIIKAPLPLDEDGYPYLPEGFVV